MVSKIVECTIEQETMQECMAAAMKELTGAGFRLYAYLQSMAELEDGHSVFQLCQKDVCEFTGMSERTYFLAVKDLADNGYLRPKAGKRRYYIFSGKGN